MLFSRYHAKRSSGADVWFGRTPDDLPNIKIETLKSDIFAAYSGPDCGLTLVHQLEIDKLTDVNCCETASFQQQQLLPHHLSEQSKQRQLQQQSCPQALIAGVKCWNIKNRKAYGISMSLYDQHPVNGRISGDPIADSFGLCTRQNNALLVVADGVNWGEKPKLASRCAVYGCMKFINEHLFKENNSSILEHDVQLETTQDIFRLLLNAVKAAHEMILRHEGGMTTLCIAFICQIKNSPQFAVCVVNVGDSLAFVFSKRHGVREITTGSHDIQAERDIRDAGGAIGPVNGCEPELHNLTCSMTFVEPGDIVYLTTDGISDNFDPVVTKIAVAKTKKITQRDQSQQKSFLLDQSTNVAEVKPMHDDDHHMVKCDVPNSYDHSKREEHQHSEICAENDEEMSGASPHMKQNKGLTVNENLADCCMREGVGDKEVVGGIFGVELTQKCDEEESDYNVSADESCDGKPVMAPHERHRYAVKEMEKVIHEFELFTESACSAQELCGAVLQQVLKLTDPKRKVLENPRLYGRRLKVKDREKRDTEIAAKLSKSAGKLDHATIIGYEVGFYQGNDDEESAEQDVQNDSDAENDTSRTSDIDVEALNFTNDHFSMIMTDASYLQ